MTIRSLLFWAAAVVGFLYWRSSQHHLPPPGIVAGAGPAAAPYTQFVRQPTRDGEHTVVPLATYHLRARVLGVKRYRDGGSDVAPYDLALGWGPMSDSAVYGALKMSQGRRIFTCAFTSREAADASGMDGHCSNLHILPVNDDVAAAFAKVQADDVVTISGNLVQVDGPNGEPLATPARQALARGCGTLYLTNLQVEEPVDR